MHSVLQLTRFSALAGPTNMPEIVSGHLPVGDCHWNRRRTPWHGGCFTLLAAESNIVLQTRVGVILFAGPFDNEETDVSGSLS